MRVKFVYEGHRVEVKVTWATKVDNLYSCKTSIGNRPNSVSIKHSHVVCAYHGVFDYGGSDGVTAVFVTLPEVTTRNWVQAISPDLRYSASMGKTAATASAFGHWGAMGNCMRHMCPNVQTRKAFKAERADSYESSTAYGHGRTRPPEFGAGGIVAQILSCCKILSTRLVALQCRKMCFFCLYSRAIAVSPAMRPPRIPVRSTPVLTVLN